MLKLTIALAIAALCAFPADFSGTWTGTYQFETPEGKDREQVLRADFKQSGDRVTGTIGERGEFELREGKADGDTLTFHVVSREGNRLNAIFKLTGDTLAGEATGKADEQPVKAVCKLKRDAAAASPKASTGQSTGVAGVWTGELQMVAPDGSVAQTRPGHIVLKDENGVLSGTGGSDVEHQQPLNELKLVGDALTFYFLDGGARVNVKMIVAGNEMSGEANADVDGRKQRALLKFKRGG